MQAIYSGQGDQDVEVYARDAQGRTVKPTSATVVIVDLLYPDTAEDSDRIILASGAATVDATATTTSAAAGPREADARLITVLDATGFVVGRKYALTAAGLTEAFELDRIDSLNLYARDHLRSRFASGAAVTGLRVTGTFPSATANDAAELTRDPPGIFGCDWVFTGTTGAPVVRTLAKIERRAKALRSTADDLLLLDPQLAASTHSRTVIESHIRQADRELDALLHYRGDSLADTDPGDVASLAVSFRALELAYRVLGQTHEERANWAQREAKRWTKMVIDGHKSADAVETTRGTDKARPTRSRLGLGVL